MYLTEFVDMLQEIYEESGDMLVLDGMFEPYDKDDLNYGFMTDAEGHLVPTLRV